MRTSSLAFSLILAAASVATLAADVYDVQTITDNTAASTRNELVHGIEQWHDLAAIGGVRDEDWFRISQQPYSSYEVTLDSVSNDIGTGLRFARMASDGATILQQALPIGLGYARSLRFVNDTASPVDNQYIVVRTPACSTACGTDDVYRIRMADTTAAVPRFNNTSTQVTVLLLQNPTAYSVSGTAYFWTAAGSLVATEPFNMPARNAAVINTSAFTSGLSGSITITHSARYGDLAGKAVALEPATGFSFDTPLQHKAR